MYACVLLLALSLSSTMDIRGCRSDSIKRKKKRKQYVRCMRTKILFFFDSLTHRAMAVENKE